MRQWKLIDDATAKEIWDATLMKFPDGNMFLSFGWGEFRKIYGLNIYRWVAVSEDNEIVALFQGEACKYLGIGVIFGLGGPVGELGICGDLLQKQFLDTLEVTRCYCHIYPTYQYKVEDALSLRNHHWKRPLYIPKFYSGLSMCLELTKGKEGILKGFSKNWRHNLRRSSKYEFVVEQCDKLKPELIFSVYQSMTSLKNIPLQFSIREIEKLLKVFKSQIIIYRCIDKSGEIISLRGCLIIQDYGMDLFAATTESGRKVYASYANFWELIQECIKRGVKYYDMNGIDTTQNPGVYNFKKGTGAVPQEYLGAWEWASSEPLRIAFNLVRYTRARFKEESLKFKSKLNKLFTSSFYGLIYLIP